MDYGGSLATEIEWNVDGYNYAGGDAGYGSNMQGGYYDMNPYGGTDATTLTGNYTGTGGPGTPSRVDMDCWNK